MIQHSIAILECKKCHKQTADTIHSTRWIKDKIKNKMVACANCDSRKILVVDAIETESARKYGLVEIYEAWKRGK